jgi:hypothetical protein
MFGERPTATVPPKVDAAAAPPRTEEVPNVKPPNPCTDVLALCALAVADATHTASVAKMIDNLRRMMRTLRALACDERATPVPLETAEKHREIVTPRGGRRER